MWDWRLQAAVWAFGLAFGASSLHAFPEIYACNPGQPDAFDILLFSGGKAVTTRSTGNEPARGGRAFWNRSGNRTMVFSANGPTDVLDFNRDGDPIRYRGFVSGQLIDEQIIRPTDPKQINGRLALFTGIWIFPKAGVPGGVYALLRSNGEALMAPGLAGRWTLVADGARCEWRDGSVDLLVRTRSGVERRTWTSAASAGRDPDQRSPIRRVGEDGLRVLP